MTNPLAQIDPVHLEQWLKILFWLAAGITSVIVAISHLTGKNNKREIQTPLEVTPHAAPASRAELEEKDRQAHGRMNRERKEIDERIDRLETASRAAIEKVESKIDNNTSLTAKIDGQVGQINQSFHALSNSLTAFLRDQAKRHD